MEETTYEYHTGYAPVVNDFFDLAIDKGRKDEIIPFLKKLTQEERDLIGEAVAMYDLAHRIEYKSPFRVSWDAEEKTREIIKAIKEACGYIPRFMFSYNEPRDAFRIVRYACFNREQIKGIDWHWYTFATPTEVDQMMEWYVPEWFADYLREQRAKSNVYLTYATILKWRRMGLIDEIPPGDIAGLLVRHFYYYKEAKKENVPDPIEYITKWINDYPEILDEIKLLFQYPTSAYYTDHDSAFREKLGMGPLSYIFKHYSEKGVFDRQWVLKEAATACTNNFTSKEAVYWYPELLTAMAPTKEELLSLQEDLFMGLGCIYSQVPQALLKIIRPIVNEPGFHVEGVMAQLPGLLSSETKALVKATLSFVADLLKYYPDQRNALCEHLAIVFIHKNEELQVKVAKWIVKFGDKETLAPTLSSYQEMMLMATREILVDFLKDENITTSEQPEENTTVLPLTREENRIKEIDNIEELVFRLGEAFETFPAGSIDHIPQALIRFNKDINEEVMQQFSPAIKAAEKALTKWMRGKHLTDEILAYFFLLYCSRRLEDLSQEHTVVKKLRKKYEKLTPEMVEWVNKFMKSDQSVPFSPWIDILNQFMMIIDNGKDLPLLSVPTHEPCWIDPVVFLQRLIRYREAQVSPGSYDFQVAIQRLDLSKANEALKIADAYGEGLYLELFTYLFDREKPLPETIEYPELWMACTTPWYEREIPAQLAESFPGVSPALLTAKFEWETIRKEFSNRQYNSEKRAYEDIPYTLPRLQFQYTTMPLKELEGKNYIGAFMWTRFQYYAYNFSWDMSRLLTLFPNNPEVLLARFTCEYAQAFDADYDHVLIPVLELLQDLNRPVLPMGSLYIALCLLYQGKTTRSYAAEVWAALTASSHADQQEIGRSLGRLLQNGHGPLKRFTDNLFEVMLNRSPQHNRALEQLIAACLTQLDEKPLPHFKKLLEAYKELLSQNGSHVNAELIPILDKWAEGTLKKLIMEIKQK